MYGEFVLTKLARNQMGKEVMKGAVRGPFKQDVEDEAQQRLPVACGEVLLESS